MTNNIEVLKDEFIYYELNYSIALNSGNGKKAIKYSEKQIEIWETIRKMGNKAKDSFAELMYHKERKIRGAAACLMLKHKHKEAFEVLEELSKVDDSAGWYAKQTLDRWNEGRWKLDD